MNLDKASWRDFYEIFGSLNVNFIIKLVRISK